MTISKDEQLRRDAAAVDVDLLWSWAPLHSGLGHDVPVFMTARRKTARVQAYALPRCQLDAWHSGGLAPTGSMVPGTACHNTRTAGPSVLLKISCSIGTIGRLLQTADTKDRLSCRRNCDGSASTHTGTRMSIGQYNGGARQMAIFWAYRDRSDNRWEPKRTCVA